MALIKESGRSVGEGALLNGRFELIECVGAGGMSTVYKALDRRKLLFNKREPYVAVKILNPRFAPDSGRLGGQPTGMQVSRTNLDEATGWRPGLPI